VKALEHSKPPELYSQNKSVFNIMPLSRFLFDETKEALIDASGTRSLFTTVRYVLTGLVLVTVGGAIYTISNMNKPPYRDKL
jgi:hypothetical protein